MPNPFEDERPPKRYSWMVLGGSIALGLLVRKLTSTKKPLRPIYDHIEAPRGSSDEPSWEGPEATTDPINEPHETAWDRIKQSALTALASAFTELATRAAPVVLNRLTGQRPDKPPIAGRPESSEPVLMPDDEPFQEPASEKDLKS